MEVENHHDSLPSFDILQPFKVSPVNDKRALYIGDGPMPGNLFSMGVHETYRYHLDKQFHSLLFSGLYRRISILLFQRAIYS